MCGAELGHPGVVLRFRSCEPSPSASPPPPPLRVASHQTRRRASSAPVVSVIAIANVVGTYFDAADAKEPPIVRIAYRDRFLAAAAAALVAGTAG